LNFTAGIGLRAYDGLIGLAMDDGSAPRPVGLYWEREARPHIKFDFKVFRYATGWAATVPAALPLALSAAGAGLLWRRERIQRRRAMKGHCPKCGYDLQGLASANCPECGAAPALAAPTAGAV
jgi:hypothetical protein